MTHTAFRASRAVAWLMGLFITFAVLAPSSALARDVPPLRAHVNDTADMLSPTAEQQLEQKLTAYESKSQHQFALLTIDSLDGDALEDFSMRTVEAWKLGKKGKDDGLLLLIVKADHKLRIEVGYGLEGDVTDAFTSRVLRNVVTPALRAGQAEQGIEQAFDVLMQKASGGAVPDSAVAPPAPARGGPSPFALVALLFFLLPFLLPLLLARGGMRRSGLLLGGLGGWGGYGGGGWGRGGGGGGWGGGGGGGGFSGGGGGFGGGGASGSW